MAGLVSPERAPGVLLDNSVWARAADGRLPQDAQRRLNASIAEGRVWTCPASLLEIRYSARASEDFATIARELSALPAAPLAARAAEAAVVAQAELAAKPGVSHRVPLVDLLVAAIASTEGLGILHYDADYDVIVEHTSLRFASLWAAPRGSID